MPLSPTPTSRRTMLLGGAAAIAAAGLGYSALKPRPVRAASDPNHVTPLAIPPLDRGRVEGGVRIFGLTLQKGTSRFFRGLDTPTLGINAAYLGPVLRLRSGERTRFNVTNDIGEASTLHWHGFNLPARTDGGPHQIIAPGTTWSPEFEIVERASTMWFHSHMFHKTAPQVWAGLAGMAIIDDAESDALPLPRSYGVDDIPVVLQDRAFLNDGTMPYRPGIPQRMMGMIGNFPMVNGVIAPYLEVTTRRLRLRLLNGSNASIYHLRFSDNRPFHQIASDGGLLAAPVPMSRLQLAPGERAEIVVEITGSAPFRLLNDPAAGRRGGGMMGGGMMGGMMGGGVPAFSFLELRPAESLSPSPELPARLVDMPAADVAAATRTRQFQLQMGMMASGFRISGKEMDIDRIDHVVKRGEAEIWEVSSNGMIPHPFHVHNTQFRVIDRNGAPPPANEAGLKDTVVINPGEVVRILVRFDRYADAERPYMYHCHILEHEDGGMMGQFAVV